MKSLGCWLVDAGASVLALIATARMRREQSRYQRQCYLDALEAEYR